MNLRSSGRRDSSHTSSAPILLESLKIKSKQDKSKNQLCHQSPGYKFICPPRRGRRRQQTQVKPGVLGSPGTHKRRRPPPRKPSSFLPRFQKPEESVEDGMKDVRSWQSGRVLGGQDPSTPSLPLSAAPSIYRHGRLQARPPEPSGLPPRPHAREPPSPLGRSVCGFPPASGLLGNTHLPAKSL